MVVIKKFLIIVLIFVNTACSNELFIDEDNNKVYINNNILNSPLIEERLGTVISDKQKTFEIENFYYASSITKSIVRFVFDKKSKKLNVFEKIFFNTKFNKYFGYRVNILNGKKIQDISSSYIEKIESKIELVDYNFEERKKCLILSLLIKKETINLSYCNINNDNMFLIDYLFDDDLFEVSKYLNCSSSNQQYESCKEIGFINKKHNLYYKPRKSKKSKKYLIEGDQVTLLNDQTDDKGQKWYFINYKGKKDLNMWIKAEAINIPD